MSIRKRTWTTRKGETKEAWVCDYTDQHGKRHIQTFERKKDADAWSASTKLEVRDGTHTAASKSKTIKEAGDLWIKSAEQNNLERATIALYRQHLAQHIVPHIGATTLSELTAPMVRAFEDKLSHTSSPAMVRKIRNSLSGVLADAQERGLVARNVVRDLRARRRRGKERQAERRERGKLKVGVDIPTPDEIKAILAAADGRWRPLLLTAIFCGLRASELRGLRWSDVDFKKGELHVRQRADRFNDIGKPKSEAGERTIPIPPGVLNALKAWKLECPKGKLDLVFPNGAGRIENHGNIVSRGLWPIEIAAGVGEVVKDDDGEVVLDEDGEPVRRARYTGLHSLRHFFASWCINRRVDGGLELPAKVVQERLGHSTVVLTLDRYGHLFPRGDDTSELAAAEARLFAS
jgi:integrase